MGKLIKRILLTLFLVSPVCFASSSIGVNSFSGLDTQDPPNALQPNQSQDLLNVRLQPGGRSVKKRDGYGLFQTLNGISTATVHGGYHFQQTGGADVQLWGSDTGLFASVSDASFVKVATGTVGATWQCTDNLGFAYCVTSSGVDTPIKTDGTLANTSYQPAIPTGTLITSTPLQLIVGGVPGSPSTIYVSANNNFLNFTAGPLPTDPYTEIINSPGSRLTQLAYYFGNVYWWKDQSVGYVSGSGSQGTVGITIVSNQIGTLDNSSAFWNPTTYDTGNHFNTGAGPTSSGNPYFNELQQLGGIFFRGQDNHIYQYDGYNLTRLSRIITPNITSSSRKKADSWILDSASDWNSGTPIVLDTATVPGFIKLPSIQDSFSSLGNWTQNPTPWTLSSGTATPTSYSTFVSSMTQTIPMSVGGQNGLAYFFNGKASITCQTHTGTDFCSQATLSVCGPDHCDSVSLTKDNVTKEFMVYLDSGPFSGAGYQLTGIPYDTNLHTLSIVRDNSGLMLDYFDGILIHSLADTSLYPTKAVITDSDSGFGDTSASFSGFNFSYSTGVFISPIHNLSGISSFSGFNVNQSLSGGNSAYTICSSTNSNMGFPTSCAVQAINSQISIATGTYVQWSATFTVANATQTVSLDNASINWFEGTATDKAYIAYFQDAILFSVSSGSNTATNNTIFYLDLLNNTWLKDNIPANGFAVENNTLYIGDPLSANVYKFGGVTTDKGNAIKSFWKSMDFTGQDPTVQNDYDQADFAFGQSSNTVTFTYQVDQSTSLVVYKFVPLYSTSNSILKRGFALDKKAIGTYFNFSVGDNSSLAAWTLMGERTTYTPLPWRPQESN